MEDSKLWENKHTLHLNAKLATSGLLAYRALPLLENSCMSQGYSHDVDKVLTSILISCRVCVHSQLMQVLATNTSTKHIQVRDEKVYY